MVVGLGLEDEADLDFLEVVGAAVETGSSTIFRFRFAIVYVYLYSSLRVVNFFVVVEA